MGYKKPQLVKTLEYKNDGCIVEMYLDRNDLDFYAELDGKTYRASSAEDLEEAINRAAKVPSALDWIPVIEITSTTERPKEPSPSRRRAERSDPKWDDAAGAQLGFGAKRYWVARKPDKTWIQADWVPREEERADATPETDWWERHYIPEDSDVRRFRRHGAIDWHRDNGAFKVPNVLVKERYNNRVETITYVRHTEELWRQVVALESRIREAARRLDELLKSEEGRIVLFTGHSPLALPAAPEPEVQPKRRFVARRAQS